ncbi:MAG: response regulator [Syntrophobacteraceae bacterium]|jgi:signal transduction histidine kinase/CheY-like chemotaxis protein
MVDGMQTVLVVDDERVIREGCRRLLEPEGYKILTAENGRQALDLLPVEAPDLILCDLVMPVMGAFEVMEEVRANYPDLPLIIITGHGTVANAVEAMQKGAFDFVTKPFRADHLTLIVKRALEKRALECRARELQDEQIRNLYDLSVEKSRIATIIDCMADGVLVTNRDLEIVLYNPALMRLFDFETPSLSGPSALHDCMEEEGLNKALRSILDSPCDGAGQISGEFSRGNRYVHVVSAPVRGLDGEVIGTVTVFQDVTIFKQLDEMKTSFVQLVSHELRSPLASIMQLLTVVLDGLAGELTARQMDLLNRSQLKIRSLLDLINDLLDVAKIESSRKSRQKAPLDMGEILEHTVALMKSAAEKQNIALRLEIPVGLPLIQSDPQSMEELISNLLGNAINYSPDGGEIVVSAGLKADFLEVCVSDTGIGIAAEEIPKIFDKFYRVKDPRTRHLRGTGLGLAIVKAIVDSNGGSVEVDSKPGLGTTFRVLLPILQ